MRLPNTRKAKVASKPIQVAEYSGGWSFFSKDTDGPFAAQDWFVLRPAVTALLRQRATRGSPAAPIAALFSNYLVEK